jgi:Putative binding domain, N-terminal
VDVTTAAGCTWTVFNTNAWVIVANSTNVGSGSVTYSVTANPNASFRSGTFLIAGQQFFITQTGGVATCAYTLSSTSGTFGSSSATGLVSVTTAAGCAWTTINTNAWITIAAGANGSGNGLVRYVLTANTSASARSGNLSIAGQSFVVTQSGTAGTPPTIHLSGPRPGSGATLSVHGREGYTNVVECSVDLIHWIPISTNSTPDAFIDSTGTNAPRRFYRTYELP